MESEAGYGAGEREPEQRRDARGALLFDTRVTPKARLVGPLSLAEPGRLRWASWEAMTVHETSFFRDVRPFEALQRTILPRLVQARTEQRKLRIWCAACSTGQEAYSLAMMVLEQIPEAGGWDIRIVGTDVSPEVVEYARAGRYRRAEVNRGFRRGC